MLAAMAGFPLITQRSLVQIQPVQPLSDGSASAGSLAAMATAAGRVIVTVEAKTDETFGPVVGRYLAADRKRKQVEPTFHSNVGKRVDALLAALFGPALQAHNCELRYQLVHATAASLIEARRRDATLAIMVVHEFVQPAAVNPRRLERNAKDLEQFVHVLWPAGSAWKPGQLTGPISVRGGGLVPSDVPLLIGKVTTALP